MSSDLPEPLTPAECDLSGMPYMPLIIVRLLDSDFYALSTGDEFKAGLTLWCRAFLQLPAGSLPDNEKILARLSGAGKDWPKVRAMALHGWVKCSDGRLYHPVVAQKALESWTTRQDYRDRMAKAREAKALKNQSVTPNGGGGNTQHAPSDAECITGSIIEVNDRPITGSIIEPITEPVIGPVTEPIPAPITALKGREGKGREVSKKESKKDTKAPPWTRLLASCNDPRATLWSEGLTQIQAITGLPPPRAKALLGRWLRDLRDDCTALLQIIQAALDTNPIDPIPWIAKAVKARTCRGQNAFIQLAIEEHDTSTDDIIARLESPTHVH